jgi:hypothetical protein
MDSFLRQVNCSHQEKSFIADQFAQHNIQYRDLTSLDANLLSDVGIKIVGTQLHLLRAVRKEFNQQTTTTAHYSRSPSQPATTHNNHHRNNNSPPPPTNTGRSRRSPHTGLGMSTTTMESLKSPYLCTIPLIATKEYRSLWKTFNKILGITILNRVQVAFDQLPLTNLELPCILNLLLFDSGQNSYKYMHLLPDAANISAKDVTQHLLPDKYNATYKMLEEAGPYDMESLVLVFDKDLIKAYKANPSQLALAIAETISVRVEEDHVKRSVANNGSADTAVEQ